jgi:hypothetical protein
VLHLADDPVVVAARVQGVYAAVDRRMHSGEQRASARRGKVVGVAEAEVVARARERARELLVVGAEHVDGERAMAAQRRQRAARMREADEDQRRIERD